MTLNKALSLFNMVYFLTLLIPFQSKAASLVTENIKLNDRAIVNYSINFVAASCDISLPSTYNLGDLMVGRQEHSPFRVAINCDSGVPIIAGINAIPKIGSVDSSGEKINLLSRDNVSNGSYLSIKNSDGKNIKFSDQYDDIFCENITPSLTVSSFCDLTPVTEVHSDDTFGLVSAVIVFNVSYK